MVDLLNLSDVCSIVDCELAERLLFWRVVLGCSDISGVCCVAGCVVSELLLFTAAVLLSRSVMSDVCCTAVGGSILTV